MQRVGRSSIEVFFDLDPSGAGGVLWLASGDIVTTQFRQGAGTFINHPWGIAVRDAGPTDRRVVITDIDLIKACAIPPAGGGPIDLHYYAILSSPAFCLSTAVEPTTWGQIKTMHKRDPPAAVLGGGAGGSGRRLARWLPPRGGSHRPVPTPQRSPVPPAALARAARSARRRAFPFTGARPPW